MNCVDSFVKVILPTTYLSIRRVSPSSDKSFPYSILFWVWVKKKVWVGARIFSPVKDNTFSLISDVTLFKILGKRYFK